MDFREFWSVNNAIKLEREKLQADQKDALIKELIEAIEGAGCICEMRIGNPMVSDHSPRCKALQDALAKAKGEDDE